MNRIRFLTLAASILSIHLTAVVRAQERVSFSQSYRFALEKTERVPIQQALEAQREEGVAQAVGGFLPTVSLDGTYYLRSSARGDKSWSASLGARQPLFDGLRNFAALGVAQRERDAQRELVQQERIALFAEVAQAHFGVISADEDLKNLETLLDLTERRSKELRGRVKLGRSRPSELLTTEAQEAVLRSQIMQAEGAIADARARFHEATGLDATTVALSPDGLELPRSIASLDRFRAQIEDRPDIRALQSRLEAAEKSVDFARGGHFPELSLFGNYYWVSTDRSRNAWDLGLGLSLPIFSGGVTQSQVRENAELARQRELELAARRRQANSQIESAYANLNAGVQQIGALEAAVKILEKNLREQQRDYSFGQATNLDVLQALNSLQDTQRVLDRTRYQSLIAYASLLASVGKTEP